MSEENTSIVSRKRDRIFSVSTRGWAALMVIVTVCAMGFLSIDVKEPLYTLSVAITSFYFGQNQKQAPPSSNP